MKPADHEAVKAFLHDTPVFGGLDDAVLDRVAARMDEVTLPAGATVYNEGDQGRELFVIRSGEIELLRAARSGRPVALTRLGPKDVFGDMTILDMQSRSATVLARSPATLYRLTNADLYALYREDIKAYLVIIQNLARELCRRLRRADSRVAELVDAEASRAEAAGEPVKNGLEST